MHAKLTAIVSLLFLFALAACVSNSSKLNDVQIGMAKSNVVALLGQPDGSRAQANIEYLTYYLSNETGPRKEPYMVRLVDAKVESFGRFIQLSDVYRRPTTSARSLGMGAILPYSVDTDVASQLEQLKVLKDQGRLTESEFERAKQDLLGVRN